MLSAASFAGFGVEEAVQQPGRVKHIDHKHTEQQLRDGSALSAALCGFSVARWEHGSYYRTITEIVVWLKERL